MTRFFFSCSFGLAANGLEFVRILCHRDNIHPSSSSDAINQAIYTRVDRYCVIESESVVFRVCEFSLATPCVAASSFIYVVIKLFYFFFYSVRQNRNLNLNLRNSRVEILVKNSYDQPASEAYFPYQ